MNKVLTNINQDLSALEKQTARGNIGAENASNRVTSIDENSTDVQYPSAKCMFNALQNVGGGGYKDGGQLVDGDFIKVENNSISSYDNVSRNEINFYFEPKQGEVLNSVIQLTTQVNATVNVYYLNENNIFVLLSNIGSNTVNAGDEYSINVTGKSYEVEQETPPNPDPNEYITLLYGKGCKFKKIGSYYWQQYDNVGIIPGVRYKSKNNTVYYNLKDLFAKNNVFDNGYILPNNSCLQNLYTALGKTYSTAGEVLKNTSGWNASTYPGNNSAGLNFNGVGYLIGDNDNNLGEGGYWAYRSGAGSVQAMQLLYNSYYTNGAQLYNDTDKVFACVRFIKPV